MSNGRDGRSFGGFEKAPSFHQVRTHRRRFATMHDMMRRSRAREVALQTVVPAQFESAANNANSNASPRTGCASLHYRNSA